MGMYYKRLDYSKNVGGRHPIAAYEFLGPNVAGKDMILIDDMISSGDTILKIASLLKDRGAGRIYLCSTFGLFTDNPLRNSMKHMLLACLTSFSLPIWYISLRNFLQNHITFPVI